MAEPTSTKKVGNFLRTIPPFHLLPDMAIQELVLTLSIEHFSRAEIILSPSGPANKHLYLILSGGVQFFVPTPGGNDVDRLVDMRGPKEMFGLFSFLSNSPSPFKVIAVEETVCYLLNKKVFKRLLDTNPDVLLYFTMGPSKGNIFSGPFPGPQSLPLALTPEMDPLLFSERIKEIMHSQVLTCRPEENVMAAAQLMNQQKAGSIVVVNQDNAPIGIVTDGDLRKKVVAAGRKPEMAVQEIMSRPVHSIAPEAFTIEAILTMIQTRFKYLTVMEGEELIGIISERDLMASQGSNPLALIKEIQDASTLSQVIQIRKNMDRTLQTLLERGSNTKEICQLITLVNDHLTQKIISLVVQEMIEETGGPPPVAFAWVAFGSEGRSEQTLTTDQDNAIFFDDVQTNQEEKVRAYFATLAEKVVSGLEQCGFARCTGGIMASNPKWCQPLRVWKEYYQKWILDRELTSQEIIISSIFFDLRAIYGSEPFVSVIKENIAEYIGQSKTFISLLALTALEHKTPISFFNRFVVETSGQYKNRLNIKLHGLIPLVDALRTLALDQNISKTNTLDRIDALIEKGALPASEGDELREAYNLMMLLRMHHHVDLLEQDKTPDNYINPSELTSLQRTMLKSAFKAIEQLHSLLEVRYGLSALRQR